MVHFCVFGGYEAELSPGRKVYVTVFGGADLKRPPLASLVARYRQEAARLLLQRQCFFLTIFGGTSINWPTLAEEYVALMDGLRTSSLTLEEWDRGVVQVAGEGLPPTGSFTVFGSLNGDGVPPENKELDDLSLQRHMGQIPEAAVERLMLAIGQKGAPRLAAVRQAVAESLSAKS